MTLDFRRALCVGVVASVCLLPSIVSTQRRSYERENLAGRWAVGGEVLVRFKNGGGAPADVTAQVDLEGEEPVGGSDWRRLRSRSRAARTLIQMLKARGDVMEVEPNYIIDAEATPNDPLFSYLWGLKNSVVVDADIHATAAWDIVTGSSTNVVGVVDTGVDYTHPDLASNMWSAPATFTVTVGGRSITCPPGTHGFNAIAFTCDPADDYGHGTHVAGTIGARGNNGLGVVGVNWTTRIMALKMMDASGSGSVADAINAIEFALQAKSRFASTNGANVRVLSNSWLASGGSGALETEIGRANLADMLFVAAAGNAAGNNDAEPVYPASSTQPNVLAVAASTSSDALASFSNYGASSVDVAAPGENIGSTVPGGGYANNSGTSMATPHVSGAAMLVLSACSLTTQQLKSALLSNVDILPAFTGIVSSNGRLNVDKAVRSCATLPAVTLTSPSEGATFTALASVGLAATATASAGLDRVEFYQGTTLVGTDTSSPYGVTWSNVAAGTYTLTAKAYDLQGLSATSAAVHITVNAASGGGTSATFVSTDTTTQGSWKGVKGADGFVIANDTTSLPSYATTSVSGQANYTWTASTTDVRALQKGAAADRLAATWFSGSGFSIDVNLTDGAPHQVSVYVVDWDVLGRVETLEVRDAVSNALLDTRAASGFTTGRYYTWTISGHVVIRVLNSGGVNAVVSGLFFDPVTTSP